MTGRFKRGFFDFLGRDSASLFFKGDAVFEGEAGAMAVLPLPLEGPAIAVIWIIEDGSKHMIFDCNPPVASQDGVVKL
jgi:hypothetical protein